jgi:transposase InsO family protein
MMPAVTEPPSPNGLPTAITQSPTRGLASAKRTNGKPCRAVATGVYRPARELFDRYRFKTQAEARMAVFEFIEGFYNPRRRHSSIRYLSPIDYERRHAPPDRR